MAKSGQKFEFAINQFLDIENRKYFMGVLLDQVPTTNHRMRAVRKYFAQPRSPMLESLRCGLLRFPYFSTRAPRKLLHDPSPARLVIAPPIG